MALPTYNIRVYAKFEIRIAFATTETINNNSNKRIHNYMDYYLLGKGMNLMYNVYGVLL